MNIRAMIRCASAAPVRRRDERHRSREMSRMTLVDTDEVAAAAALMSTPPVEPAAAIRVGGKFFFAGERKHFVKGVTYGTFRIGSHGAPFPEPAVVDRDFALMSEAGINTVRVFTVPPLWLLDAAQDGGVAGAGRAALAAAHRLSRQPRDPGGYPRGGHRRGSRLRAPSGGLRLSGRQRDPARHDPLARRRAGAALSEGPRRPGQSASTRRRWSATPTFRRPNT